MVLAVDIGNSNICIGGLSGAGHRDILFTVRMVTRPRCTADEYAAELLKKCPEFDILLTAEAKGIPLAHEMSRQSGKPYVCARKGIKLYMKEPVVVEDQSITTAGKQKLVIDRKELDKMNGKRVLVVDDVISTGGSLKALDALAEQTKCTIVGQAAVLAEGDAAERKDIIFLEPLPLFLH